MYVWAVASGGKGVAWGGGGGEEWKSGSDGKSWGAREGSGVVL